MKNAIVPKYFQTDRSVITIKIKGKEWFDKFNGNSYNAVQVFVNYGLKKAFSFSIPFQYGYGNYYEQSALEYLHKLKVISSRHIPDNSNIIKVSNIERNCLKRDVVAFGAALTQINQ